MLNHGPQQRRCLSAIRSAQVVRKSLNLTPVESGKVRRNSYPTQRGSVLFTAVSKFGVPELHGETAEGSLDICQLNDRRTVQERNAGRDFIRERRFPVPT